MSQGVVEFHPCKFCLNAYDEYKIIGHLKELHKHEPGVEKEITKVQNKIKKRSAPAPPVGQQTNSELMATEDDTRLLKCKFCKTRIEGDSVIRGLYNHVRLAHPDEKAALNFLAVKIAEDVKPVNVEDSTSIKIKMEKLQIPAEQDHSLSVYDKCTFCSSTFSGAHKKTDFYLHIKTKHVDVYHDEWEKLLKIEKAAKKKPELDFQQIREQIETTGKQINLTPQEAAQINDKTNIVVKLENNHNSNGQIIIEKTLDCGPKILVESELSKTSKSPIRSLIDASISSMNSSTNNYQGKRRISHFSKMKTDPGSDSDKLPEVKNNNDEKQPILPNASASTKSARASLLNLTDKEIEERDKALNAKVEVLSATTSADKPPAKTTNKAPQPKKKQLKMKRPKQPVKKKRKRRKNGSSDSQSSDFEPDIQVKKSPSKIIKPQLNAAPEPDSESNPNPPSASTESITMTQQEIDEIPDPDPPLKTLRKRVKKISYDIDDLEDSDEHINEPRVIKIPIPRKIISKLVPPNCKYCKEVLPERTEKSYLAHLSSGNCKGITIVKKEPPPITERKDSLELIEELKFYCPICQEMFKTCANVEEHIGFEHYKYKCEYCSKRFFHIMNMALHLDLVHQEIISPPYESLSLTKMFCKIPKLELEKVDSNQNQMNDVEGMVRKYFNYIYNVLISTNSSKVKVEPEMETICKVCGELVKFNTRDLKELKLHCLIHDPIYLSIETCSFCKRKFLSREQYKDHLKINHQISNFTEAPELFIDSSNSNPAPARKSHKIIKPRLIKYHENDSESEISDFEDSETGDSDTDFEGDFEQDLNNEILVRLCHVCGITLSESTINYHFNLHDFDKKCVCCFCNQRYDEESKLQEHQNICKLKPIQKKKFISKKVELFELNTVGPNASN